MRYLAFAHEQFYPGGGWKDFRGSFATAEEAKAAIDAGMRTDEYGPGFEHGHVVDIDAERVVWERWVDEDWEAPA